MSLASVPSVFIAELIVLISRPGLPRLPPRQSTVSRREARGLSTNWLVKDKPGHGTFSARLAGAGHHLPATRLTTGQLMATTRHSTHIDLERLTGIHERRVSIGDEDSYSLATSAALDCLDRAQQDAASLDVVISCSITKFRGGLAQWIEPTMSSGVASPSGAKTR
jgi:3-oxoacyl-[acyl-carrier-protein] synthase III